jgi:hypothetical protein
VGVLVTGIGVAVTTTVCTTGGAALGALATAAVITGDGEAGTLVWAQPDSSTSDAKRPTRKLRLSALKVTPFMILLEVRVCL